MLNVLLLLPKGQLVGWLVGYGVPNGYVTTLRGSKSSYINVTTNDIMRRRTSLRTIYLVHSVQKSNNTM